MTGPTDDHRPDQRPDDRPDDRDNRQLPGLLVVLAGPSGVGKGTVRERVFEELPDARLSVSATTRPARPGEEPGVHYDFVDREDFERRITEGELLEWAEYVGNLYGTPLRQVEEQVAAGHVVFLDIEVQGALQVKQRKPDALMIFLVPPSWEELERRLRSRGTEDESTMRQRLHTAREELAQQERFDLVLVNDDVDRCAGDVLEAIHEARTEDRGGD